MNKIRVKYNSDIHSIFFKKGEVYDAFSLEEYPNCGLIAFHFSEEEMDEEGYYALPANRFTFVE